MKYQHFVFDVDGTLLDTREADLKSLQETVMALKKKIPNSKQLLCALNLSSEDALKQLKIENVEQGIALWKENRQKYIHSIHLFDGIHFLIEQLKNRGIHLGIITSKNRNEYRQDFSTFEISTLFETVICIEDTFLPKPFPDPLLTYVKKNKIGKREILYVGNDFNDAICAFQAKIDFALALWGSSFKEEIKADYYINYPREILYLIRK